MVYPSARFHKRLYTNEANYNLLQMTLQDNYFQQQRNKNYATYMMYQNKSSSFLVMTTYGMILMTIKA